MKISSYLNNASRKMDQYLAKYGDSGFKTFWMFLLWNIGRLFSFRGPIRPKKDSTVRIACVLKGGVGDILVAMCFVQNFDRFLASDSSVDHLIDLGIPTKRALLDTVQTLSRHQTFFRNIVAPRQLQNDYDLVFEMVRFPKILYFNKKKVLTLAPKLAQWVEAVERFHRENPLLLRHATPGDYLGARWTLLQGRNRLSQADIGGIIGVESIFRPHLSADRSTVRAKFSLENVRFVTIQRGVGGGNRNVSTKLWPLDSYERLVVLTKKRFPDVKIVQIGTKKNLPIPGVDLDLRGETAFEEVMTLVAEADVHLDGECGMVHLRHFLNAKPSLVLFGPTDEAFYGYPENINLRSDACPGGCEWLSASYTTCCPRGLDENECLTRLSPETVLDSLAKLLER